MARTKGITFHTRLSRYQRYMARNVDKLWGARKMIKFYKKGLAAGLHLETQIAIAEAGNWWLDRYAMKIQDKKN